MKFVLKKCASLIIKKWKKAANEKNRTVKSRKNQCARGRIRQKGTREYLQHTPSKKWG